MKYVIANWKANKTIDGAVDWMKQFTKHDFSQIKDQFRIIIAAPFHALTTVKNVTDQYIFMNTGAQDLSRLPSGAYTGEVTAQMLYGLVDYVLIGHSERRNVFHETNEDVAQKAKQAKSFGIEPIICIRSGEDTIPAHTKFVMFEPPGSIGTGNNQPVSDVLHAQSMIDPMHRYTFIYGGSVDTSNIQDYVQQEHINGIVMGSASLDPDHFYATITAALT